MITLQEFIGGILHGLTVSRTMADRTSRKVADHYLKDEYLRGFPVPRLTLEQVSVEVKFAVGATSRLESLLKEPAVSDNIVHKFRAVFVELPKTDLFKKELGQGISVDHRWNEGVDALVSTVERIIGKAADMDLLVHTLTLAIENFFYEVHHREPEKGLLAKIGKMFEPSRGPASDTEEESQALRKWAAERVSAILQSALPDDFTPDDGPPDLNILVGSPDLQGHSPEGLQTANLSFTCEDRKWVSHERNGEKTYVLDR